MENNDKILHDHHSFRKVPRTGVIFVMTEARRYGYRPGHPEWANFGQGMPEAGPLKGAPPRRNALSIAPDDLEYGPVAGLDELREAVASHYNRLFRRGRKSQYSAENVCISPGGRSALTRLAASLSSINLGHFLPDYTAYEELLHVFRRFTAIPILLDPADGYELSTGAFEKEILGRGLGALLFSNPCNPTGKTIRGQELSDWIGTARRLNCSLILDEFYSHYVWISDRDKSGVKQSAAEFVEDVERDPIVICDGLTKNWRYPGWRIAWTLGPRKVIEGMSSAGSFLDGGASRPLQAAAIDLLEDDVVMAESAAIQSTFGRKRRLMIDGLRRLGLHIDREPEGTFYVWADGRHLGDGFNSGCNFFEQALTHKVVTVPGKYFDVDPGRRRSHRPGRFGHHLRFSFGPPEEELQRGLEALARMLSQRSPE